MSDVPHARAGVDSLIATLLRITHLSRRGDRDALLDDVANALRRPLDPSRSEDPAADLAAIVDAAAPFSGGLPTIASVLRRTHPGEPTEDFVRQVTEFAGPHLLSSSDRDALREILATVSIEDLSDATEAINDPPELSSIRVWRDRAAAIQVMERLPRVGGAPPLLAYVLKLTEVLGGAGEEHAAQVRRLQSWAAAVSPGLVEVLPLPVSEPPPVTASTAIYGNVIWGNVPGRNRHFTGRAELLDKLMVTLREGKRTSVLPQTLQGLGGVGKTQLVVEYVYRHQQEYDMVWWIPAEQTTTVLNSFVELAERLSLPTDLDRSDVARMVLATLVESDMQWLLIYDNADDPDELRPLIPSTGGHVIVTTRNQDWSGIGPILEVDVFRRDESIEMLRNRTKEQSGGGITEKEAEQLAELLGDLPLALEQAAAWYLATRMPVQEYVELLDSHINELLAEGKPSSYSNSIAAFVAVALKELRSIALRDLPQSTGVAAQLFSLFAYLGGEPVAVSLFRAGSQADISEPLRSVLNASIPTNRAVRLLSQYGLARVDAKQRVQVHRLVQKVLRDTLTAEQRAVTLRDVRNLLTAANPGDPDEEGEHDRQLELGPHIEPAGMIDAKDDQTRQVVLDHTRYLHIRGDYENAQKLATLAAETWAEKTDGPTTGPDRSKTGPTGEQTLQARAQIANAIRALGYSREAAVMMDEIYRLQRKYLGPDHELTLVNGNQVGQDLRIAGKYVKALEFDTENLARCVRIFDREHPYTLRAQANLAVDHRMIGQFGEALRLDREIAVHWENTGAVDVRALRVYMNLARNYYGMGAYKDALRRLEKWRPLLHGTSGPNHPHVLLADRTYAVTLRKLGRVTEAVALLEENLNQTRARFPSRPNHEFVLAATTSYANALREAGEVDKAAELFADAIGRYRHDFGSDHPLALVAEVNEGIVRRARGETSATHDASERSFAELTRVLTPDHPYAISAGAALANDYAAAGNWAAALELSRRLAPLGVEGYRIGEAERLGVDHPYRLARAVNTAKFMHQTGDAAGAEALRQEALGSMRLLLGEDHPDVLAAADGVLLDGDIEPPPT